MSRGCWAWRGEREGGDWKKTKKCRRTNRRRSTRRVRRVRKREGNRQGKKRRKKKSKNKKIKIKVTDDKEKTDIAGCSVCPFVLVCVHSVGILLRPTGSEHFLLQ